MIWGDLGSPAHAVGGQEMVLPRVVHGASQGEDVRPSEKTAQLGQRRFWASRAKRPFWALSARGRRCP